MYKKIENKTDVFMFKLIGEYAKNKKLKVEYFTYKFPSMSIDFLNLNKDFEEIKDIMNEIKYIHIYKKGKLLISIFYDDKNALATFMEGSYYELFDGNDTFKYLETEKTNLYKHVQKIINNLYI